MSYKKKSVPKHPKTKATRSKLDSKTGENSSTTSTTGSKFSTIIEDADLENTTIEDIDSEEVFKPKIISPEKRTGIL